MCVHIRAREALKVVFTRRLRLGRRGPNAAELRADAKAGEGLAEKRTDGRHRQGGHLRGVRRSEVGGSEASCPRHA
jgi:hypothetical protein